MLGFHEKIHDAWLCNERASWFMHELSLLRRIHDITKVEIVELKNAESGESVLNLKDY